MGTYGKRYVLDENREPQLCEDAVRWGEWMMTPNRLVDLTEMGDVAVSTVFLGIDHAFGGGPPVLFETMVFGGKLDQEMMRYHTWDDAVRGHAEMVERVAREG